MKSIKSFIIVCGGILSQIVCSAYTESVDTLKLVPNSQPVNGYIPAILVSVPKGYKSVRNLYTSFFIEYPGRQFILVETRKFDGMLPPNPESVRITSIEEDDFRSGLFDMWELPPDYKKTYRKRMFMYRLEGNVADITVYSNYKNVYRLLSSISGNHELSDSLHSAAQVKWWKEMNRQDVVKAMKPYSIESRGDGTALFSSSYTDTVTILSGWKNVIYTSGWKICYPHNEYILISSTEETTTDFGVFRPYSSFFNHERDYHPEATSQPYGRIRYVLTFMNRNKSTIVDVSVRPQHVRRFLSTIGVKYPDLYFYHINEKWWKEDDDEY